MNCNCPKLIEGVNYRETADYPLVLTRDTGAWLTHDLGAKYYFRTGSQLLGIHEKGILTVCAGYATDTYSPCWKKPSWMPGRSRFLHVTPVPKHAGYAPALFHDLTRQFFPVEGCPWTREDCDDLLYEMMLAGGESERIAGAYHAAVAGIVGDIWIEATRTSNIGLTVERVPYA